jgi:hypothetical protein
LWFWRYVFITGYFIDLFINFYWDFRMKNSFWDDDKIKLVKKIYKKKHVTEHIIAAREFMNITGLKITASAIQNVAAKYSIPRPYVEHGGKRKIKSKMYPIQGEK